MRLKVKVDGQIFEVEIGNISERPIKAVVDGEAFEVWPESYSSYTGPALPKAPHKEGIPESAKRSSTLSTTITKTVEAKKTLPADEMTLAEPTRIITAPIPGVITAILVQSGSEVNIGQELCKLEAMKMNNSIRSSRAGRVATIHVTIGQHVKHNDVLIEFAG